MQSGKGSVRPRRHARHKARRPGFVSSHNRPGRAPDRIERLVFLGSHAFRAAAAEPGPSPWAHLLAQWPSGPPAGFGKRAAGAADGGQSANSHSPPPLLSAAPPALAGTSFPLLAAPYRSVRDRYARPQSASRFAKVAPEEIVNAKYNRRPGGCKACRTRRPAGDQLHRRLRSSGGQGPSRRILGSVLCKVRE